MYLGLIQKLHAMTVTTKTRIRAEDVYNIGALYVDETPYKMKNGRLEVPADYKGKLFGFVAQILGNQKMVVKVDYESKDPVPLVLAVGDQKLEPHYADGARAVWNLNVGDKSDVVKVYFEFHSSGGKDFKIISAEIDYEEL